MTLPAESTGGYKQHLLEHIIEHGGETTFEPSQVNALYGTVHDEELRGLQSEHADAYHAAYNEVMAGRLRTRR